MTGTGLDAHLFVVFGGTGDLMERKLLPALYRLNSQGHHNRFQILGVGRSRDHDDDRFRTWARKALSEVEASSEKQAAGQEIAFAKASSRTRSILHSSLGHSLSRTKSIIRETVLSMTRTSEGSTRSSLSTGRWG